MFNSLRGLTRRSTAASVSEVARGTSHGPSQSGLPLQRAFNLGKEAASTQQQQQRPLVTETAVAASSGTVVQSALGMVKFAVKAYIALLLGICVFQRKLIFMTRDSVIDPRYRGGDPQVITMPSKVINTRLAAAYYKATDPQAPVLVYFHGNADELGNGAAFLGQHFQQRGLGFLGLEYPGYGLSKPGAPTEANIYQASEELLQRLSTRLKLDPNRLVLLGQSIGCGVAVEMAKRGFGHKIVLISPFTSMPEMAAEVYPFLKPALAVVPFMLFDKFDNKAKAPSLELPALVVHGTKDEIVPYEMGKTVAKLLRAQFLSVPGGGHNDPFEVSVLSAIEDFARG
mmetsp:Transcript_58730/g.128928  ORF Transcript_58730/g.128928 Transcript_58730/m.128928 type:complete len:342 (+) Transcript_58730:191-1216(+)|eukprot:CAMPEP_0206608324 /NCGR_PEP_ID=MMETSP0325_2-20121206/52922_1 /ASSEMBLY_ACC=CAM_ASM_000347 /TAXON_ID=2866 /ORGANISM="Crypthecodinium cohnii, Strain Seligo" /LENGTH=341 /DNA_ID=CAMNT_0054125995 /DNA_START=97 /DNA_END=1122 /DNA_ORIENTATION=+